MLFLLLTTALNCPAITVRDFNCILADIEATGAIASRVRIETTNDNVHILAFASPEILKATKPFYDKTFTYLSTDRITPPILNKLAHRALLSSLEYVWSKEIRFKSLNAYVDAEKTNMIFVGMTTNPPGKNVFTMVLNDKLAITRYQVRRNSSGVGRS